MSVIRKEATAFANLWNVHKIRYQKKRFNAVVNQSFFNYEYSQNDTLRYEFFFDASLINQLKAKIADYDKIEKTVYACKTFENVLIFE